MVVVLTAAEKGTSPIDRDLRSLRRLHRWNARRERNPGLCRALQTEHLLKSYACENKKVLS